MPAPHLEIGMLKPLTIMLDFSIFPTSLKFFIYKI